MKIHGLIITKIHVCPFIFPLLTGIGMLIFFSFYKNFNSDLFRLAVDELFSMPVR